MERQGWGRADAMATPANRAATPTDKVSRPTDKVLGTTDKTLAAPGSLRTPSPKLRREPTESIPGALDAFRKNREPGSVKF